MTPIKRLRVFGIASLAFATLTVPGGSPASAATNSASPAAVAPNYQPLTPAGDDGMFVPIAPVRLFDTRNSAGSLIQTPAKPVTPGAELKVDLAKVPPIKDGGRIVAVALNLTATNAVSGGYVVSYECGTPAPTSSLNVQPGGTQANAAIVSLPQGVNELCFKASTTLNLIVDVTGYFSSTADDASTYVPIEPKRVFDTRTGKNSIWSLPLGQRKRGDVIKVPIADLDLYRDGEEPVSIDLRITTAGSSTPGYVVAYPCADGKPNTSTVNLSLTEARTNAAIIPVDKAGDICIRAMGTTDIILDVSGYFASGTAGYFYIPIEPIRALDTRPEFPGVLTSPSGKLPFDAIAIVNLGSLNYGGLTPKAVTANITTVNATGAGHLRAWPSGQPSTNTSVSNYPGGPLARASAAILGLGTSGPDTGQVQMATSKDTDLVIDVTGIFTD